MLLQQCLPFTVLKHLVRPVAPKKVEEVATVLTVYGIETHHPYHLQAHYYVLLQQCLPFTVLKPKFYGEVKIKVHIVATVLTVYGIET